MQFIVFFGKLGCAETYRLGNHYASLQIYLKCFTRRRYCSPENSTTLVVLRHTFAG